MLHAALPTDKQAFLYLYNVCDMIYELSSSDVRDYIALEAISKVTQSSYGRHQNKDTQSRIFFGISKLPLHEKLELVYNRYKIQMGG